jgi:hypothetical protein
MPGGLIQLVTTGIQDSPIIGNPEITFFKTVYKQHTQFSICQNERYIGSMEFDKPLSYAIDKSGDLLYNQYLKLEIPYFEILKTTIQNQQIDLGYNINSLDVTYGNSNCIVFYSDTSKSWYIIPENLFKLSSFEQVIYLINSYKLEPNLLHEYIKVTNLGQYVNYYQVKENNISSIISILRVNSNFFEQYWLDLISKSTDINMFNKLVSITSEYDSLFGKFKNRIFNYFQYRYFYAKNIAYYDFSKLDETGIYYKTETERYFEYINSFEQAINNLDTYDIDTAYKHTKNNFLNWDSYKNNILPYNSKLILLIFELLYSDYNLNYFFWKKYNIQDKNEINYTIKIENTNFINEWQENIDLFLSNYVGLTFINNQIYEKIISVFYETEKRINNLFINLVLSDAKSIYIKLKTLQNRFIKIPNYQLNFNDNFMSTKYIIDVSAEYNKDNYKQSYNNEQNKYPTLKNEYDKLDTINEMNNLTPVDFCNIFGIISEEIIDNCFSFMKFNNSLKSFLILWKNSIYNRLYKRFIDTYKNIKNESILFDFNSNRKLTFYHSMYPSNLYDFNDFKQSFNEMFWKNSWLGSLNIEYNNFEKLKENIFNIQSYDLFTTDFQKNNKNFYKLNISNTYTYTYISNPEKVDNYNKTNFKVFNYDMENNSIYIKYDNYYDSNSKISLMLDGVSISYTTIQNKIIQSENNIKCLYLLFEDLKIGLTSLNSIYNELDGKNLVMTVNYETYVPIVCFMEQNINPIIISNLTLSNPVTNGVYIIDSNKLYFGEGGMWVLQYSKKFIITLSSLSNYTDKFIKTLSDGTIVIMHHNYPNIQSNKYLLFNNFSNNIINNQVMIQNTISSNNTIKLLTINYNLSAKIQIPLSSFNLNLQSSINTQSVTPGEYIYVISYYTIDSETDISEHKAQNVNLGQKIYIENIPISNAKNVIGRRIYRTKSNSNSFYLLVDIKDNVTISYEDNISDNELGIEYNISNNIKYNYLPKSDSSNRTEKTLIKLVQDDELYTVTDMNNKVIQLPSNYENIYEIYIEEIKLPYESISTNEYYINNMGQIILDSYKQDDISKLMYMVNPSNLMDNYKLTCSKKNIPFRLSAAFILTGKTGGNLTPLTTYTYKISFYNSQSNIESLPSNIISVTLSGTQNCVDIKITSPIYDKTYDSWKIYRNLASITGSSNTFFCVGIKMASISENYVNVFTDIISDSDIYNNIDTAKYNEYVNPFFYLSRQINSQLINKPSKSPNLSVYGYGNITIGLYNYMVSYYNSVTKEETFTSNISSITIISLSKVSVTIPISPDSRVTARRIYRSTQAGNFYLLIEIKNNITTIYIDNITETSLKTSTFLPTLERPSVAPRLADNGAGVLNAGTYKYKVTFYNSVTNEETTGSIANEITLTVGRQVLVTVSYASDSRIYERRLYRTKSNGNDYYLIANISGKNLATYSDNNPDSSLTSELVIKSNKGIQYNIVKYPIENIVPNLNNFISHSTDLSFVNNKKLSDFSDYVFNKPFIMLVNNSTYNNFYNFYDVTKSFKSANMMFYNISFNINSTSTITLDDIPVNYLTSISSQQFFIKESELIEPYYKNDFANNTTIACETNEIIQRTFNPAFDEFNLTNIFLDMGYYRDIFVDNIVSKIDDILYYNPDYKIITDIINQCSNIYTSSLTSLLDRNNSTLYGNTSNKTIYNISQGNKLNNIFNDKTIQFDLLNYSNMDYIKYSHSALKLYNDTNIKSDVNYIAFENSSNIINILTPFWDYYNSNNKISSETVSYLNNIPNFFSQHIDYVNDNINYLNISNPNNYKEQFLSFDEIQQHKFDNFYDYSGSNEISLLHPIVDSNIYKFKIDNTEITNYQLDVSDKNKMITNQYTKSVQKNNYYDAEYKMENRNQQQEAKFNYVGIANVYDNDFIYNDDYIPVKASTHYLTDDNKILKGQYDSSIGRYIFGASSCENKPDIPDMLVINPTEIAFNDYKLGIPSTVTLQALSNTMNYYKVRVNVNNSSAFDLETTFLINDRFIKGYYQQNLDYGILTILTQYDLVFDSNDLIYMSTPDDYSTWVNLSNVSSYIVERFKKFNYKSNSISLDADYFKLANKYYNFETNCEIININNYSNNGTYFYIDEQALNSYVSITAQTTTSLLTLETDEINTYIIYLNKLYIRTPSTWELVKDKYFKINSDAYCRIEYDGTIIKEIDLSVSPNEAYIWLYPMVNTYSNITANNVDTISSGTVDENKYYISLSKLYLGDSIVTSGNYLISSDSIYYDGQLVRIDNLGNIIIWEPITINYTSPPSTPNNGDYYYNNNNVLYYYDSSWKVVSNGHYLIGNSKVKTEYDGTIIRINEINADSGSILDTPILSTYIIDNNKLYYGVYENKLKWKLITDEEYIIKSNISIYNNKCIKPDPNGFISFVNLRNEILSNNKTTMLISNNQANSYFKRYNFSKQLREVDDDNYILLVDLTKTPNRHFMLQKKNMSASQIPTGSYHCWYIPKSYLNLITFNVNIDIDTSGNVSNISNIPNNSYYLVKNGTLSCIYYYSSGTTITISDSIDYYQVKNISSITQIFMIDNKLFNINMKQLIGIYKMKQSSENFITKELQTNSGDFSFDSTYELSYQSEFIKSCYDVSYFKSNVLELLGENEILVNMILKRTSNNHVIYHPIIVKKQESYIIPNINFDYTVTSSSTISFIIIESYQKSFVVISDTVLSLSSTKLTTDYYIGTINVITAGDTFYSMSPYLTIDNTSYSLTLKSGFDIKSVSYGLHLWKVKGVRPTGEQYYFYFWTLITNNNTLAHDYLDLNSTTPNIGISEPFYLSSNNLTNYGTTHSIITCTPSILEQSNDDFIIKIDNNVNRKIGYKYYCDTRQNDTVNYSHDLLTLDYNMIFNIKPYVEVMLKTNFINYSLSYIIKKFATQFGKESNIFILTYLDNSDNKKKMYAVTRTDYLDFSNKTENSNYAVYYSINYPQFVSNYITIHYKSDDNYEVSFYDKKFLEMGEIISVDGNYFYVEGINIFTNNYELTLIRPGNNLNYTYNGYYTFGNYLRDDNRIIPEINYENTMKLKYSTTVSTGDIYYSNQTSQLTLTTQTNTFNNINIFDESRLKIKLFYEDGRLFMFDNFIQLKILDKLIYCGTSNMIYQIINIRDNEIFLNNTFGNSSIVSDSFVEFILPYQPFIPKYLEFDSNGNIKSDNLIDNQTIIFDIFNCQNITANSGPTSGPVTIGTYIIDGTKLYIGTINNVWEQINSGIYFITSNNNTYNQQYCKAETDCTLSIFTPITANKKTQLYYPTGTYVIENDKLYVGTGPSSPVSLVSTGYYMIGLSDILKYNDVFVTFSKNNNLMIYNNIYNVLNNKIDVEKSFTAGYYWVRLWKTNYVSFFDNSLYVPPNYSTKSYPLNNNYPIKIDILFDYSNSRFEVLNTNIITSYEFYYGQTVKYLGNYNYIKEIKFDGTNMYIYMKNPLILNSSLDNTNFELIISPRFNNQYEYYTNLKFKYNFGLQPVFYNKIKPKDLYQVIRYVIKDDKLVFIQKYTIKNKPIMFEYGKTVQQNEIINEIIDDYQSVYFYEYSAVNSDGTFNNYDTIIGTWHLYTELNFDWNNIILTRMIYPNILIKYDKADNPVFPEYIDRIFGYKSNIFNEITYLAPSIIESKNMIEKNDIPVEIICKYDVKVIGMPIMPTISNNTWAQEISFFSGYTFNYDIYKIIYLDESFSQSYKIVYTNGKYYIVSPNYISNQIKTLYTKNINYLVSAIRPKTLKTENMDDTTNEFFINTRIIDNELLSMKINISKVNPDELIYKYELIDGTDNFTVNKTDEYYIQDVNNRINIINNDNRTIVPKNVLDYELTEISKEFVTTSIYIINPINLENIIDTVRLFNNVKQLRVKLLEQSIVTDTDIFNYLKPWKSWSIINAVKNVEALGNNIIYDVKLQWNNTTLSVDKINTTNQFLNNDEIKQLSKFIKTVAAQSIAKSNYIMMRDNIEPYIINNITNWLNNPDFFMNTLEHINSFLSSSGYPVYFDGTNIIFKNDKEPTYILINETNEIASYITDEFTYDDVNEIVERTNSNFNNIDIQINNWLGKVKMENINDRKFGISIHKLLRYLVKLGDELKELINYFIQPFNETPQYIYNNPLKFIINKIWEKYNETEPLVNLEQNFNDSLTMYNNFNFNGQLFGGVIYLGDLSVTEIGIFTRIYYIDIIINTLTEFNLSNLFNNNPNLLVPVTNTFNLVSSSIYPYKVNFYNNQIKANSIYSIDLLNGTNIANDIQITNPLIYPDQINFSSKYNIKPSDFIVVKEKTNYNIISTKILGYSYKITFYDNVDINYVDEICFRNYNLNIISKDNKTVNILIPLTSTENTELKLINYTDLFELKNYLAIKEITITNGKQYISFYNELSINANFVVDKTLLKTNSNLYILKKDGIKYYVEGTIIDSSEYDVSITILVNPKILTDMRRVCYLYSLDSPIQNINLVVPLDFKIKEVVPTAVNIFENNTLVMHYDIEDYNTIIKSDNWDTISYTKRLDQKITNKIDEILLEDEYLYYFNMILPKVDTTLNELVPKPTTTIYTYDILPQDIDISLGIYEPTIDTINKTSIYINQTETATSFTIKKDYLFSELANDTSFIQKNNWNLPDYNTLTITEINSGKPYYKYNGDNIEINVPSDFVYKSETNYYYKFANTVLDSSQFIFSNRILTFNWNNTAITGNKDFQQYYIESNRGLVNVPAQNRKAKITINHPYQYTSQDKFYMIPYSGNSNEFDNFLYIIEIPDKTFMSGNMFMSAYSFENIYLNSENGDLYTGKIFDKYYSSNKMYFIISLPSKINETINYTYYLDDNIEDKVISVNFYQDSLQFANFYEQNEQSKIYLFVNKSVHDYTYINAPYNSITTPIYNSAPNIAPSDNFYINSINNKLYKSDGLQWSLESSKRYFVTSTTSKYDGKFISTLGDGTIIFDKVVSKPNKFYLVSYDEYLVTNIFNENKFIQNDNMKKDIQTTSITTQTTEIPKWPHSSRLINYIRLYFNDQLIEEMNEDTYNLSYYLYSSEEGRKQLENMTRIRFSNNKWKLYMPIIFWFSKNASLAIPTIAMPNTEIRLEYKLNQLEYILENDLSGTYKYIFPDNYRNIMNPSIKTTLCNEFILLDTDERKLFGSYSHEYIIERNIIYPNNYIYDESVVLPKKFSGLIKDIYMITKSISNPKMTYLTNHYIKTDKRDAKYKRYQEALIYSKQYMINNVYTSNEQRDYADDIDIIIQNNILFNDYMKETSKYQLITNLINFFSSFEEWDTNYDLLKYLMYYQIKYLSAFDSVTQTGKINYLITMYLKYQYSTQIIWEEESFISSLTIKANGTDLFSERDWLYFNSAVPYSKFKNSLPQGYYAYTFSLYPLDGQPSGHLNFTNFDDIVMKVKSNPLVVNNKSESQVLNNEPKPYILSTVVKEYNILRIMSGFGSVAWIN